jgi:hypothetical protein
MQFFKLNLRSISALLIFVIYMYLQVCMLLGSPFFAYDHENYIAFLNAPSLFFFEPIYTFVAYIVNSSFAESIRFQIVFLVFTIPPLILISTGNFQSQERTRLLLAFLVIILKGFYIGFIAQRFFFTELLSTVILTRILMGKLSTASLIFPGLIHFSALTLFPGVFWLKLKFKYYRFLIALLFIYFLYLFLTLFSNFSFFNYDYSHHKYLETVGKGSLLSVLQIIGLICLVYLMLDRECAKRAIGLALLALFLKLLLNDIEVFSRIFQIQTNLIIIFAIVNAKRLLALPLFFAFGFFLLQYFATDKSQEVFDIHLMAITNSLDKILMFL